MKIYILISMNIDLSDDFKNPSTSRHHEPPISSELPDDGYRGMIINKKEKELFLITFCTLVKPQKLLFIAF